MHTTYMDDIIKCKLLASFKSIKIFVKGYDGFTTDELPIGHHYFYIEFTKTGPSKLFYKEPLNFIIRPTSMYV